MTKAIIFDFDGLILDTEYPEYQAWSRVYQDRGLDLPMASWAAIIGRGPTTIVKTPYDSLEEELGHPVDRDAVRSEKRAHFTDQMRSATILPGVRSLLAEAKNAKVLVGLASSSPRDWVVGYLQQFGLLEYFDAIRTRDDVRVAKPAPDLYLSVLDALGVSPNEAITLEDSAPGIAAAKAAGIFCIAVPNRLTRLTSLDAADFEVGSLVELSLSRILRKEQMP
jgi:HAD superfamily hydrolase (TIGR01509 family)